MHIILEKSDFQKVILTVSTGVSIKTTMPILSNILLETTGNQLRCAATDLEVSLDYKISATVKKEGGIALPAKKLSDIVRELPDAPVELTTENHIAKLTCERASFTLSGMPKEDFPQIPGFPKDILFELEQTLLKKMIRKTKFSVSTEELRYALNGIYFQTREDELRLVATDGRRLSYIRNKLKKKSKENIGVIIPTKAINELEQILEDEGNIDISQNGNQIFFRTDKVILTSRLIDGQFPNYEQVIPSQREKSVLINTDRFLQALRRVSILASEKSRQVKITLQPKLMIVNANTPELGEAKDELDIDYNNEEMQVAYNVQYVMDVLKNIDSKETLLELNQPLSPGVLRPSDDEQYINVIMPIKLT